MILVDDLIEVPVKFVLAGIADPPGWICQEASVTIALAPNSKVTFCKPINILFQF